MSNANSTAVVIGRLAGDPRIFTNQDGSKKVLITVYVDRSYTDREGNRISDALPFEAFVRAETNGTGPYGHIHQGDLIAVSYEPRMARYTKAGVEVFEVKLEIQNVTFLEPRPVTQARLAKRQAQAAASAPAAQPAPAAQAAPAQTGPVAVNQPVAAGAQGGTDDLPF